MWCIVSSGAADYLTHSPYEEFDRVADDQKHNPQNHEVHKKLYQEQAD